MVLTASTFNLRQNELTRNNSRLNQISKNHLIFWNHFNVYLLSLSFMICTLSFTMIRIVFTNLRLLFQLFLITNKCLATHFPVRISVWNIWNKGEHLQLKNCLFSCLFVVNAQCDQDDQILYLFLIHVIPLLNDQ